MENGMRNEKYERTWAIGYLCVIIGGLLAIGVVVADIVFDMGIDSLYAWVGVGLIVVGLVLTWIADSDSDK
jgi:hypothetical protein